MTKEEIRQKHLLKNGLFANKGPVGKAIQKAAHDAMDEYAKEVAIDFFKWYGVRMATFIEYITKIKPLVESYEIEQKIKEHEGSSIAELFDQYLTSKTTKE